MPNPIMGIPPHIRALPEAEQGPALVQAIHERKLRAGVREEVLDICREQHQLGVRHGVTAIRQALVRTRDLYPAASHLSAGLTLAVGIIETIEKEALNGQLTG